MFVEFMLFSYQHTQQQSELEIFSFGPWSITGKPGVRVESQSMYTIHPHTRNMSALFRAAFVNWISWSSAWQQQQQQQRSGSFRVAFPRLISSLLQPPTLNVKGLRATARTYPNSNIYNNFVYAYTTETTCERSIYKNAHRRTRESDVAKKRIELHALSEHGRKSRKHGHDYTLYTQRTLLRAVRNAGLNGERKRCGRNAHNKETILDSSSNNTILRTSGANE